VGIRIKLRRDISGNWATNNPTLESGEPGYETDTGKIKIGDGATAWNALSYISDSLKLNITDIDDVPVNNETSAPISSNWAYDHNASTSTHGLSGKLSIADIDDTPVDGVVNAPISSNWAYDHVAAADPHTGYLKEADIDDTPVDGEVSAPISSNWAYDHVAASDPHTGYVKESAVDDTPVDGATADPISSNWAYDHNANVTTKHLPSQPGTVVANYFLKTSGSTAAWAGIITGDNPIINGNFTVDQEGLGVSPGQTVTTQGKYFCDMWMAVPTNYAPHQASGYTATVETGEDIYYGKLVANSLGSLSETGDTYTSGFLYYIEYWNIIQFRDNYFVISFDFKSSTSGTFSFVLRNGDGSYSYVSDFTYTTAGTWQTITKSIYITSALIVNGTNGRGLHVLIGFVANPTGAYAASSYLDTWRPGNYLSSNAATEWQVNAAGVEYIAVRQAYSGLNTIPAQYPLRHITIEQTLCQRYATRVFSNYSCVGSGHCNTATNGRVLVPIPVQMRSTPSVALSSSAGNWRVVSNGSAFTPSAIAGVAYNPLNGVVLNVTISGAAGSHPCILISNTSSEYINFTARM